MNLQTNKETWVCWNNGSKRDFYRYELLKYIECGKNKSDNILKSGEKIYSLYNPRFNMYHNVIHKNIYEDEFDANQKNYIIITSLEFASLIYNIKNIPKDLCDFAKKHNIKIFLLYIEHPLQKEYVEEFDLCFEKYISKDSFKSKNIKVIVNSFDEIKTSLYPDAFIYFDTYSYLMRTYFKSSSIKDEYPFLENRKYNFSMSIGTLLDRFERVVILNYMFENDLIDDRFFYTLICNDKKATLESIKFDLETKIDKYLKKDLHLKQSIEKNINLFLEQKVYDENGIKLSDKFNIVYDNGMNYKIPLQVRQSCINILFETKIEAPSLTEKIYKPIVAGIPFVWYGPLKSSDYLISKGYKLYPFIDYSFDKVIDPIERMYVFLSEIKRLKSLGSEELQKKVIEYKDISIYNQETFIKNTDNLNELHEKIRKCI